MSESNPPGKRRFYQNVLDAYRLTTRTYPALPWMLLGTAAAVIAVFMLVAWLTNMSLIGWLIVGIMGSFTAALLLLSILTRRALYSQVEDKAETKRVTKVMRNVPVHQVQVGHDEGQIALKDLQRVLRKLKNVLTPEEVPQVSARINALRSGEPPIPKGIDPLRAKPSRRALRGN